MSKKVLILGASGSIGQQTVDVISQHSDAYQITGVSVGHNIEFLKSFLNHCPVGFVCVQQPQQLPALQEEYPSVRFFSGSDGLIELTSVCDYDLAVNALQGFVGLAPTLNIIEHGHDIALANKETLVAAGELVMAAARQHKVSILPLDSEHSAIWQCLQTSQVSDISRLIITASGGSLRQYSRAELADVTRKQALNHPTWKMGAKITIDSATMMNKGFEIIEAHWLFGMPYEKIDVIIHPESVIHSMIEFKDHTVMAQLGVSDMRLPIQYALSYPRRWTNNSASLDLVQLGRLDFAAADFERYPLLQLAYETGKAGGNKAAAVNGANEAAVRMFLNDEIGFLDIEKAVFSAAAHMTFTSRCDLNDIIQTDNWARQYVLSKEWMKES